MHKILSSPAPRLLCLSGILFGLSLPQNPAAAEPVALAAYCDFVAARYGDVASDELPALRPSTVPQAVPRPLWVQRYKGVGLALPAYPDGWQVSFLGDSNDPIAGLNHADSGFGLALSGSADQSMLDALADVAGNYGLPAPSLSPLDTARVAIALDVDEVVCDTSALQTTVDRSIALLIKKNLFPLFDEAGAHGDGVLGQWQRESSTWWRYVFADPDTGRLRAIFVDQPENGGLPPLGPYFGTDSAVTTAGIPVWLPVFFEAASAPSRTNLLRLRDAMQLYAFDASVYEALDVFIATLE